jgi:hypothetical protein
MSETALARLAALVAADMATYADPAVQRVVLGEVAPRSIARLFVDWVHEHLGATPVECWLWAVSVGCVAGFQLADGSKVVVKAHPADRSEASLRSMQAVQRAAAGLGVPAPRPLSDPQPLGLSLATAEAALLEGRHPNLRMPADRQTAARGFVELIEALQGVPDDLAATRPASARSVAGVYPMPHSPLFNFETTGQGAEWIDELAREAKTTMDRLDAEAVLAHMDWRAENLRVGTQRPGIVAIYDFDAIRHEREAIAVGEVAAHHAIDWTDPDGPYFAPGTECIDFARIIEAERNRRFNGDEWAVIRAGIVYAWCYRARCEHARAVTGNDKPEFQMRSRLAADGRAILADAT